MEEEIWKDIPGYEGIYQASDLGRIRSIVGNMNRRKRVLSPGKTIWGYYQVSLTDKNHIRRHESVHKLVCLTFHPIPEGWRHLFGTHYLQVNHKDQDKTNNRADNLEWCTPKYNTRYGDCIKKRQDTRNRTGARGSMVKVRQLARSGELIREWESMAEASSELGIFKSQICCCCKGTQKTAGGYKWEYVDKVGVFEHSEETKAKMKETNRANPHRKGKHLTPEQLEKHHAAHRGIPVAQYDLDGNFIKRWDDAPTAARFLHLDSASIHHVCRGERHSKTLGGFIWKYDK